MGAGKSTIGPILANTLGWNFYDLDKVIEEKVGKKIKEIFAEEGERYFREIERKILQELSGGENLIISLGGGTMANQTNLDILKNSGEVIYLKVSPEAVFKRLIHKRDRPILKIDSEDNFNSNELMNRINRLYNERQKYYEQADITVDTDNINVGKTVDKIVMLICKLKAG